MSDLVFISIPSEAKAEEVRGKILELQKDYLIEVGDAVIATKSPSGHVKLNQLMHPTAFGAASGAFWGLLIGALFLMPLAGVAVGAASGAIGGALTDVGINDAKMKDAAQAHRAQHPERGPVYELEPYVMAGDIYGAAPYIGRGGWSWYPGSAAWLHRAAVETLLGLSVKGSRLSLAPHVPAPAAGA